MRSLLLLVFLLINAVGTFTAAVYKVTGVKTHLNIRSGPGTNYKKVGELNLHDVIYVTSISDGWAKFYKGYVSTNYLTIGTKCDRSQHKTTGKLSFRSGPSTNYDIVNTFEKGTTVNYYGRDPFTKSWAVTGKGYAYANKLNEFKSKKLKMAEAASDYAREHALSNSSGYCARYVANALNYAGFTFTRQPSAYLYHENNILKGMGFTLLSSKPNSYKKGDIIVYSNNSYYPHGHIQIYDGKTWYSDYKQNSDNVYLNNSPPRNYYRITN